ncbi:MAG: hypothetical protein ACFFDR_11490, partial [Candidatus Thorarchaeota archaeon]
LPIANAQNVHGWEWAVSVGDLSEYKMIIDYDILQDSRNVYINITSLCNLSTITAVSDIDVGHKIMYTDYSDLESIHSSAFSTYFDTPVVLPIGNWEIISENAPGLMGDYFSYLSFLVDDTVVENTTHFGFNIELVETGYLFLMNMTWFKSDGSLALYNLTFGGIDSNINLILDRLDPPQPSLVDDILGFVEDNLILVIGVVAVLCIIAGIANKK